MKHVTRRQVLGAAGGLAATAIAGPSLAQGAGSGTLARLQADKKVRVGIANQPPYSALNPDGSITGAGPDITKAIMGRLGITQIEGVTATYGELIPGMLAGRWDFVSALLTITDARCKQIRFADPLVFDGTAIVYLKGSTDLAPKSIADLAKENAVVGLQAGGALFRRAQELGVKLANLRQFTDDPATIDGLVAKRMQFALMSYTPVPALIKQRHLDAVVVYPVPDDPARGASCAFRPADTELYAAYQKELRAMKASGEYLKIIHQYGFETPPELMKVTAEEACKGQ
ncbi:MAG TPA: transporter substrate-binding domain-containing protein [Stellaceae bacterium]|nr:transporter substrate-binding domain-containing protein [Stellaceae bacterium]